MSTVRRLAPEEWPIGRSVRLRALQESPDAFASTYDEEVGRSDSWWVEGATKLAWFVAEDDGQVIGVVAGMPLAGCPEVISMWVDPGYRGRGVAAQLLEAVIMWAKTEGAACLCLAVAEDNERARRFYEQAGFVVTGPGETLRSRPEACTTEMRLLFR